MIKNVKDQAVNSEEKEFTAFLVNILQSSNIEDFERKMSQISKDELKELYRQFKNEKKISKAMDGAKLNLLNKVNKVCPEGTEMFLSGGCIKCRKKKIMTLNSKIVLSVLIRMKRQQKNIKMVVNLKYLLYHIIEIVLKQQ